MSASWICLSGEISAVSAHCSSCPGLFYSSVEGSGTCLSSSAQLKAAHAQFQPQSQAAQGFSFNLVHSSSANLCSPSPSVSGAGSASAKGFMQKPPVRPTGFSPTNTVSPMRTMDASAAARGKKQKLHEKQSQERVAAILLESALFTQLLEFVSLVDAALKRKKIDIQDSDGFVIHTKKSPDICI